MRPKLTAEQARAAFRALSGRGPYRSPTVETMKPKPKRKAKGKK